MIEMNPMLQKTLEVILIVSLTYATTYIFTHTIKAIFKKIIDGAKNSHARKQFLTLRALIISVLNAIIVLFGLMLLLAKFGISLKHLAATAGVMGLAIGFGAKRSVEDIIAGVSILTSGQVMVGDSVKIANITGVVEKMNLKIIVLRDGEGTVHYIRNSMIDIISNYSKDYSYAVFDLPFDFKINATDVVNIIKEIGSELIKNKDNKMLEEPEIFGIDKFEDGGFILKFRVKTKPGRQTMLRRVFNGRLQERLAEADITLNFGKEVRVKTI